MIRGYDDGYSNDCYWRMITMVIVGDIPTIVVGDMGTTGVVSRDMVVTEL